jgi:hypothetical protein
MVTRATVDKITEQTDLQRRLVIYCRDLTSSVNTKLSALQQNIRGPERVTYFGGTDMFYSSTVIAVELGLKQSFH